MNDYTLIARITTELLFGAPMDYAYVSNPGSPGLLAVLDGIDSTRAAVSPATGVASIAAHANHIRFFLELLLRLADGEDDPYATADWDSSWQVGAVHEERWQAIREELATVAKRWVTSLRAGTPEDPKFHEQAMASLPHLAYHVGAIMQLAKTVRIQHDY